MSLPAFEFFLFDLRMRIPALRRNFYENKRRKQLRTHKALIGTRICRLKRRGNPRRSPSGFCFSFLRYCGIERFGATAHGAAFIGVGYALDGRGRAGIKPIFLPADKTLRRIRIKSTIEILVLPLM
jgi:hypothetical protein